jgi:hypothetical protein
MSSIRSIAISLPHRQSGKGSSTRSKTDITSPRQERFTPKRKNKQGQTSLLEQCRCPFRPALKPFRRTRLELYSAPLWSRGVTHESRASALLSRRPAAFIDPCLPSRAVKAPSADRLDSRNQARRLPAESESRTRRDFDDRIRTRVRAPTRLFSGRVTRHIAVFAGLGLSIHVGS